MPIALNLNPEPEARLVAQANEQGISVEKLIECYIEQSMDVSGRSPQLVLSPHERAEQFVRWAKSHTTDAPPLSDEAISRESIC